MCPVGSPVPPQRRQGVLPSGSLREPSQPQQMTTTVATRAGSILSVCILAHAASMWRIDRVRRSTIFVQHRTVLWIPVSVIWAYRSPCCFTAVGPRHPGARLRRYSDKDQQGGEERGRWCSRQAIGGRPDKPTRTSTAESNSLGAPQPKEREAVRQRGAVCRKRRTHRTGKRKGPCFQGPCVFSWGYVDLNHGPLPYQGSALTV